MRAAGATTPGRSGRARATAWSASRSLASSSGLQRRAPEGRSQLQVQRVQDPRAGRPGNNAAPCGYRRGAGSASSAGLAFSLRGARVRATGRRHATTRAGDGTAARDDEGGRGGGTRSRVRATGGGMRRCVRATAACDDEGGRRGGGMRRCVWATAACDVACGRRGRHALSRAGDGSEPTADEQHRRGRRPPGARADDVDGRTRRRAPARGRRRRVLRAHEGVAAGSGRRDDGREFDSTAMAARGSTMADACVDDSASSGHRRRRAECSRARRGACTGPGGRVRSAGRLLPEWRNR